MRAREFFCTMKTKFSSCSMVSLRHYLRIFLAHLFSHVGLCGLVVGYSVIGALLFETLETEFEMEERKKMAVVRTKCLEDIWNITEVLNVLYKEKWQDLVGERLRKFETQILFAAKNEGYDGKVPDDSEKQWGFSGALLYSVTVITTIGYGNIAPKTNSGKIMTMLYALLGLPLMLLCLSNIGSFLANTFKFTYSKLCRCKSIKKQPKYLVVTTGTQIESLQTCKSDCQEKLTNFKAADNIPIPLIDDNSIVEMNEFTICYNNNSEIENQNIQSEALQTIFSISEEKEHFPVDKQSINLVRVPISLVLQMLVLYICVGAAIFSQWEGWDLLNGAYFCFVTLTTIGFGDLVPGSSVLGAETEEAKVVICCLYLLLGLATLAMALNLVQEEVMAKVKKIGHTLGIVQE